MFVGGGYEDETSKKTGGPSSVVCMVPISFVYAASLLLPLSYVIPRGIDPPLVFQSEAWEGEVHMYVAPFPLAVKYLTAAQKKSLRERSSSSTRTHEEGYIQKSIATLSFEPP